MNKIFDIKNCFWELFDKESGWYMRSGVFENGKDTGVDPFMRWFPALLDVGIMGHCKHGASGLCIKSGVECYQNGLGVQNPNMSVENFRRLAEECFGRCLQFALGGRGDPDQHENFKEILEICRDNKIVPNFTSSGLGFTEEIVNLCKRYCGAVAISWYNQPHTVRAIQMLLDAGVKTNIHYVLGNFSIDDAIRRLREKDFPKGINAVIFLLHKPVGLGKENNVLKANDPRVAEFFALVDSGDYDFKIGFDSCSIPGILEFTKNIDKNSIDTCEGGRFSAYVTSDMKMLPCSFDNQEMKWAYDISNDTVMNAWNSPQFENFREHFRKSCPSCPDRLACMGGCPIRPQVVLCDRKEKSKGEIA